MIKRLFRKETEYKFKEKENTACFTCDHVMNKEKPILFVSHDNDDSSWQFLFGTENHTDTNIKNISIKQAIEIDSTINELYEMPDGLCAERESVGAEWKIFRMGELKNESTTMYTHNSRYSSKFSDYSPIYRCFGVT